MSEVVIVHHAQSAVEAEAIRGWLEEQSIECRVDDPRDTAYPGILDRGRRWKVFVAARDENAARNAIEAWNDAEIAGGDGPYRGGEAEPEGHLSGPTSSQLARRSAGKRLALGALLVGSLCANFYLSLNNYALERDYFQQLEAYSELDADHERLTVAAERSNASIRYQHRLDLRDQRAQLERCQLELRHASDPTEEP